MRNALYEQALNRFGVEWEYLESVPVSEINATRGKQMQARLVPLDDSLIEEYKNLLEDGAKPPPLLLWKPGRGMWIPLDGNQRIAANERATAKHRLKAFDAYVLKSDDPMVADRLCWQFNNAVNGRRLSYEESLQHAITMVRKYGEPVTQVARDWGVKNWELTARVRELELRELAERKRIDTKHIPSSNILEVNALTVVGEDLALKAIKTIAQSGVDQKSIKAMMSAVSKAKTAEAKAKVLDDWAESEEVVRFKAETKGGRIRHRSGRTPREKLQKLLNSLWSVLDCYKAEAFRGGDMKKFREIALEVTDKLIEVYGLGAKLKGQGVA